MAMRAFDEDWIRLQDIIAEEGGDEDEERMAAVLCVAFVEANELRPVYAGLPADVVQECEVARQHMRQEFIQQLRRVRDALAPYGRFKEWCCAVHISYHTAQNMLWRADREQAVAQAHNRSPGRKRQRRQRTAEERKASGALAFITALARIPTPGGRFDLDTFREYALALLRHDNREEFHHVRDRLVMGSVHLNIAMWAVGRLQATLTEVEGEFDYRGE